MKDLTYLCKIYRISQINHCSTYAILFKKKVFFPDVDTQPGACNVYPLHGKKAFILIAFLSGAMQKKGRRKVRGVPQSQTAALPRHQEEEETASHVIFTI